eukprot:Hpha_TRINITY_DN30619_c0_g1::TRINITY_DN30619_c0_g1_i1::g.18368::m.18368
MIEASATSNWKTDGEIHCSCVVGAAADEHSSEAFSAASATGDAQLTRGPESAPRCEILVRFQGDVLVRAVEIAVGAKGVELHGGEQTSGDTYWASARASASLETGLWYTRAVLEEPQSACALTAKLIGVPAGGKVRIRGVRLYVSESGPRAPRPAARGAEGAGVPPELMLAFAKMLGGGGGAPPPFPGVTPAMPGALFPGCASLGDLAQRAAVLEGAVPVCKAAVSEPAVASAGDGETLEGLAQRVHALEDWKQQRDAEWAELLEWRRESESQSRAILAELNALKATQHPA